VLHERLSSYSGWVVMTINPTTHPPATNRGVEPPTVSQSIHWIACTFPKGVEPIFHPNLTKRYEECRAFNSYNQGSRFADGRVMLTHSTRPEMGTHVIFSGDVFGSAGVEAEAILLDLIDHGAQVRRIDLAIDAKNCGLRVLWARKLCKRHQVKTRARDMRYYEQTQTNGATQYVGTKESEIYAKIYDKAAEKGLSGDWTRIEITFQHKRAQSAAQAVIRGEDYRALVRAYVDFPTWDRWSNIFSVPLSKVPADKTIPARKKWLLAQVAPAMARVLELDGDNTFLNVWLEEVFRHRDMKDH